MELKTSSYSSVVSTIVLCLILQCFEHRFKINFEMKCMKYLESHSLTFGKALNKVLTVVSSPFYLNLLFISLQTAPLREILSDILLNSSTITFSQTLGFLVFEMYFNGNILFHSTYILMVTFCFIKIEHNG